MSTLNEAEIEQIAQQVAGAQRIMVLTGAGVSAESGLATFRDEKTGYWSQFDPEVLASPEGFARDPGLVWRWYMERYAALQRAEPNRAHHALAELEELAPHFVLATQNVDDLHERAGSSRVLHLHGSLTAFRCSACKRPYHLRYDDLQAKEPPACETCAAHVRPGVVWFGELLPHDLLHEAWAGAQECDLFLVVGTSGVVMPAAALPEVARTAGATVIEINADRSELTRRAHHFLQGRAGVLLPAFVEALRRARS